MRFTLNMTCDNAAFEEAPEQETARILRAIADRLERNEATGLFQTIHDLNGNDVGRWKLGHNADRPG